MITLDKSKHGIVVRGEETDSALCETQFPNISISQEAGFGEPFGLGSLSCLQMTAVGLYFNWYLSGKHPRIDEAMQSEVEYLPMSGPATVGDPVRPNNLEGNGVHEAEGDDSTCTTVLENFSTQGNLTESSTSAPTLTRFGDAPEGDYDLDDEMMGTVVFF